MSWVPVTYRLTGDGPMIMKSAQMANPLNRFAKALKSISSKRVKTDADHQEMGHVEFIGSLHMHAELGPVLPGAAVVAAINNAAKKTKEGQLAKCAVFAAPPGFFKLEYEGSRDPEEMFQDTTPRPTPEAEGFRFTTLVTRQKSRILSTRPIFHDWHVDVDLMFENSIINFAQLDRWIQKAGTMCGLLEWRPVYGRFMAECLTPGFAVTTSEAVDGAPKKRRRALAEV
jgi:hypothetical protein